jgi:hypothetical protein
MKTLLCIILISIFSQAYAEDWNITDKAILTAVEASYLIDWHQTRESNANGWHEFNPIIGQHASATRTNAYFIGAALGTYFLADYLSPQHRRWLLTGALALEVGMIEHNRHVGLKVRF